jgi:hypothetical protein
MGESDTRNDQVDETDADADGRAERPESAADETGERDAAPVGDEKFFERHPKLRVVLIWWGILGGAFLAFHFGLDKPATAGALVLIAMATKAFAGLVALIALIPVIGPPLATLLTLPFFFLLNGIAYLVTFVALRRGYKLTVVSARVVAAAVVVGFILGFLVGHFL